MSSSLQETLRDKHSVNIRYGKEIDYSRFKKRGFSDIQARIEALRDEAARYISKATIVLDTCPLCKSKDMDPFVTIHGYPYSKCRNCALVFLQRRLSTEALIEFWVTAVSGTTYADPEVYEYRRENVARPKVDFVLEYWQASPGKWLDLGCGIGDVLSVAKEYGWRVLGLEVSEDCVQFAQSKYSVPILQMTVQQYLNDPSFESEWDIISAIGYYDAVDNLYEEFTIAAGLLRPGGFLFTLSPHHQSLSMALAQRYPNKPCRFICPPGSTSFFCKETYGFIADEFGFVQKAFWYCGMDVYDMINYLVVLLRIEPNSAEHTSLQANLAEFQLAIDKMQMSDYVHVLYQKR